MWPQRMAVSHSHHMVETRILSSVFLPITRIQSQKADGFQPLCPLLWTDARFPGHRQTGYPLAEGSSQGCVLQEGCALRIRKRKPSMQGRAGSCGMRAAFPAFTSGSSEDKGTQAEHAGLGWQLWDESTFPAFTSGSSDRPGLCCEWAGERGPSPIRLWHVARPHIPAKTCIRRKDNVVTGLTSLPLNFLTKRE